MDKRSWVRPIGIGETLRRSITKIVMRAAGDQAKTACGILQLCTGIDASIEGATHAVVQNQRDYTRPEPGRRTDEGLEGAEYKSTAEPISTAGSGGGQQELEGYEKCRNHPGSGSQRNKGREGRTGRATISKP